MLDTLVTDLIEATRERLRELKVRSVEQVRARGSRLAGLSPRLARENRRQKEFLHSSLYSHENISAEREKIVKRVEDLFDYFVDCPRSLPARYFAKTKEEPVHRVVCDYVAGMTDNYLEEQYRKCVEE